ncbi:BON domain-containing protein [Micromonosporaceae bacterium Da 78-11]
MPEENATMTQNLRKTDHELKTAINKMTLKPQVSITPDQAKAKITAALVRRARFDARQVDVAIIGSKIELTGTVSSWSEFRQAAHVARATPGVTIVESLLTATP